MVERPDISAALISLKIIWNTGLKDDDLKWAVGVAERGAFRNCLVVVFFCDRASGVTLFEPFFTLIIKLALV